MRIWFSSLITILSILSFGASTSAQAPAQDTFTENLSLGSRGSRVILLQQMLNLTPDTFVANAGPGSLGHETEYFGSLTRSAVARFQQKYASEILTPAGLVSGSGYVGFYTRAKLNALRAFVANTANATSPAVSSTTNISPTVSPTPVTVSQNPNLKNLDEFLAAVDTVATRKGRSSSDIANMKRQIIKDAATTTDLRAAFLGKVRAKSGQSIRDDSFMGRTLVVIAQVFNGTFRAQAARAADTTAFGGALLYSYYCSCSETWLLTLSPLPPSYAVLLTYTPFSQAYLSYNIPETSWLLGQYQSGGVCITEPEADCAVDIDSDGMITPTVGSSPL